MIILADHDVIGQVDALYRTVQTGQWLTCSSLATFEQTSFDQMQLAPDASDRAVWFACQAADVVLITADRNGLRDSLELVIRDHGEPTSLPVLTLADPQRLLRDRGYLEDCALRLLDYLERMDSLRGTGRLFIP